VDVFNSRFHLVHLPGVFRDRHLPGGYAPFGIRAIDGFIYVTYAKQHADRHDDVAGPGHGFIDVFTTSGFLVERLVSRGALDSPWGLEVAPKGFGPFGGKLLVGNFGNGRIHAYGLFSGRPAGTLRLAGQPGVADLAGVRRVVRLAASPVVELVEPGRADDGLVGQPDHGERHRHPLGPRREGVLHVTAHRGLVLRHQDPLGVQPR